ncbi:MAG TPA: efflux RND transporter periplasmic adaptor subunit [Polyangia bacterium]|jgi:RND family efflux transporter MFP subunit
MRVEALAVATLVLSAAGACRPKEVAEEATKRKVRCAPAEAATLTDTLELHGTVSPLPDKDAQVAAQVGGRLLQILVREGDVVALGVPVARIDAAPLADEARAAAAGVARTRAEARNAEATAARVRRVFEHGIAARQEVDDATAREATTAAALSEAEAAAHRAERQVERATVRSPLAGVVIRIFRRAGELVDGTPATPIVEVADPSRLELRADATAGDLVRVTKGQAAEVVIAALPGASWTGAVSAVSPAVDRATGLGVARVTLDLGAGPRPPIGVLGTARVGAGSARRTVVVPKEAVRSGAGAEVEVVLCGADGLAHVRRLARGGAAGAKVEAPGLAAGQEVVVEPVIGVADGEALEVTR